MKLLIFLIPLLVWGEEATVLKPEPPKMVAPGGKQVSTEEMNTYLKIQRDQYKAWGVLQQIDKQISETEPGKQKVTWSQELEKVNKQIQDNLKNLQAKYKCDGCILGDDGKLIPQAKEVAKK